jgi:hypothetical protein
MRHRNKGTPGILPDDLARRTFARNQFAYAESSTAARIAESQREGAVSLVSCQRRG